LTNMNPSGSIAPVSPPFGSGELSTGQSCLYCTTKGTLKIGTILSVILSTVPSVATEHPKVTAYMPKEILNALDEWKQEKQIDSRSSAVVAIVADYLGVPYPVQSSSTAPSTLY
jgi:hypothetical protein